MAFDPAIFARVLGHRRTLLFLLLCLLTFYATDPSGVRTFVPLWFSILVWPVALALYLGLYHLCMLVCAGIQSRVTALRIPTPLLAFIALYPTVWFCQSWAGFVSNDRYPENVVVQMIFYFLAVQGLETVFYRFIMPSVRLEIESVTPSRHLIVGGEKIDLRDLHHIEAREHHVHVTLSDTRKLFRARLSDLVAQTRPEDGVQPHRSWWVARDQVVTPERSNGRMTLRLRDDTVVPVARTRMDDVQDWISRHIERPM